MAEAKKKQGSFTVRQMSTSEEAVAWRRFRYWESINRDKLTFTEATFSGQATCVGFTPSMGDPLFTHAASDLPTHTPSNQSHFALPPPAPLQIDSKSLDLLSRAPPPPPPPRPLMFPPTEAPKPKSKPKPKPTLTSVYIRPAAYKIHPVHRAALIATYTDPSEDVTASFTEGVTDYKQLIKWAFLSMDGPVSRRRCSNAIRLQSPCLKNQWHYDNYRIAFDELIHAGTLVVIF